MRNFGRFFLTFVLCGFCFGSFAAAKSPRIGIVWMGQSEMTERVQAAFTEKLHEMVPDAEIEFQHVEGITDFESVAAVVRRYEREKDGILLLRSNGAEWLSRNRTTIPTFIGSTNNPETIGAVKNMAQPEGNVTGVTYYLPHETQFVIFEQLLPKMDSVLLLLQKGHASTQVDREGTKAACAKRNIDYFETVCATPQDGIDAINLYKDKVSAIIIGTNNVNVENGANIVRAAGNIPVLAYTDKPVEAGALAGYVPDDAKRGRMLAESVYDVLVKKKPIREVPVKMDPDPKFLLNKAAVENLKIDIPYTVLKYAHFVQ